MAMANLPASGQGGAKGRGVDWAFGKRVAGQMSDPALSIYH